MRAHVQDSASSHVTPRSRLRAILVSPIEEGTACRALFVERSSEIRHPCPSFVLRFGVDSLRLAVVEVCMAVPHLMSYVKVQIYKTNV